MWQYISYAELYHHGIKGQKWGVRRFQNEDGSLTSAGRKRYDDDGESEKRSYKIPTTKSKHRINLEDKYQKQGMSKEQAEQMAAKRIRSEKIVAAAAAVTVVAAIAYKKHVDDGKDFTLSKDMKLQRIMSLSEGAEVRTNERAYMSYKKIDNMKYVGTMGSSERTRIGNVNRTIENLQAQGYQTKEKRMELYKMTITPKQDVKVASINRSRDTFLKLYKNDADFKNAYDKYIKDTVKEGTSTEALEKFAKGLEKGKINDNFLKKAGYKAFNTSIADPTNSDTKKVYDKFYNALKEQGKNAIVDLNDKQGMHKSSMPIITFDGSYDYSKSVLSDKEISSSLRKSVPLLIAQNTYKPAAIAFATLYSKNQITTAKSNNEYIRDYRKEHPNTTKTDKEILDLIE